MNRPEKRQASTTPLKVKFSKLLLLLLLKVNIGLGTAETHPFPPNLTELRRRERQGIGTDAEAAGDRP